MCVLHALVNGIHETEFPAIPFGSSVVLCVRHSFSLFFLLRLENGQAELHAHLIVTLSQLCQLRLTDMQFLPILEADTVNEKMGVDMVTVYVRTDQHLAVLKMLRQLQRSGMSCARINIFTRREGLYHVVEQCAIILVIEQLGTEEIIIDALRAAVDTSHQLLTPPQRFGFLHGVLHDRRHAGTGLAPGIIGKMNDRYFCHLPRS